MLQGSLAEIAKSYKKPIIIGTTGHDKDERIEIEKLTESTPMVWAGNFSTGVNLLFFLTQQAAKVLDINSEFDPEVIEMHHRLKKDAPSGTADRLLEIIMDSRKLADKDISHGREGMPGERMVTEIGSHALRGGDIVGEHTVMFAGTGERIELTHQSNGPCNLCGRCTKGSKMVNWKDPGLYSMQDVLGLKA